MPTDRQALARALRHLRGAPVEHNRHALALQGVVDAARAMFEADGAALLLPGGDELVCVAATDDAMRAVEEAQITSGQGPCRDAIASGAVVAASDITRAGAWPELAAKAGSFPIRSMLSAPVGFAGRVVGSLCVSARVVRRWSQADRATVTAYASVVGDLLEAEIGLEQVAETVEQLEHALVSRVLIEQAKGVLMARYGLDPGAAFQDMRRRARSERRKVTDVAREVLATTAVQAQSEETERVLLLTSVTQAALANTSLDGLLADLLTRIRDVLAADATAVLLLTPDGAELVQTAAVGLPAGSERVPVAVGSGVAGLVAASRNPILIEDLDQVQAPRPLLRRAGLQSWAAAPLVARGRLVGVIEVGSRQSSGLQSDILDLLELIGEPVALAIEHVRRFERARTDIVGAEERRRFLDRAAALLETARDERTLLGGLCGLAVPALADVCTVWLVEGDEGRGSKTPALRQVAQSAAEGVDEAALEAFAERHRIDAEDGDPMAVAVATGQAQLLAAPPDEPVGPGERIPGLRTGLAVPLAGDGRVLGVIVLASTDPARRYGAEDVVMVQDLSRRVAAMLEAWSTDR